LLFVNFGEQGLMTSTEWDECSSWLPTLKKMIVTGRQNVRWNGEIYLFGTRLCTWWEI